MGRTSGNSNSATEQPAGVSHAQAVALLVAVAVGCCIFIIPLGIFGIKNFWCGILFLLYWSSFEKMDNKRILPSLVGALVGLGMAYMFVALPPLLGPLAGYGITLAVIVVAVYFLIKSWLGMFINMATMLFLTVAGTPEMLHNLDFVDGAIALVVGAIYFTAVANLATYVVSRRTAEA